MANNIAKFISCDYLKESTSLQDNIDNSLLEPFILKSQDTHIQQVLGSYFTQHLYDAITNSTLTTAETNLLRNYIQKATAEWAYYECYPHLNFKSTNKAISKESSEFGQPSALEEVKYMRDAIRNLAEFYSVRLEKYLCQNSSDFPEYQNPDTPENLPKKNNSYFGGIYIPKSNASNFGIRTYNDPSDDCC